MGGKVRRHLVADAILSRTHTVRLDADVMECLMDEVSDSGVCVETMVNRLLRAHLNDLHGHETDGEANDDSTPSLPAKMRDEAMRYLSGPHGEDTRWKRATGASDE